MISWRRMLTIGLALAAFLTAAVAVIFQDNITRFRLNPQIPYQIYTPPPPPAYGARGAWALWPDDQHAGEADIFYLHSTAYASNKHWNAPLSDKRADEIIRRIAAPNEAGPFMRLGAIYGPRFREATLFSSFTHKFDGVAPRELAFMDVEKAFLHFLNERPSDRPFILVGYGQGGLHALGLIQLHINSDERLQHNLAAAYIIGESVPREVLSADNSNIPPCETPRDVRCVVAYVVLESKFEDEKRRYRQRALIWDEGRFLVSQSRTPILCVNPLSWTLTTEKIDAEHHIGAASATGLHMNSTPAPIEKAVGAQCVDGVLIVDPPRQSFLRRRHWFGDHWRPQDFNLFYHDLYEDAVRRVSTLKALQDRETVDLAPGPEDNLNQDANPNE